MVKLGKKYHDSIPGFEGVATSRHEYPYGCVRVSLEDGADGDSKEHVSDEQRLTGTPFATSSGARPPVPRTGP